MKFFRPISGKYQVRVGIYEPGSDNNSLRIYDRDTISVGVCIVLEHGFDMIIGPNPDNHPIMHCNGCIGKNLQCACCSSDGLLRDSDELSNIANDSAGLNWWLGRVDSHRAASFKKCISIPFIAHIRLAVEYGTEA
jgi:hypothetical protein